MTKKFKFHKEAIRSLAPLAIQQKQKIYKKNENCKKKIDCWCVDKRKKPKGPAKAGGTCLIFNEFVILMQDAVEKIKIAKIGLCPKPWLFFY